MSNFPRWSKSSFLVDSSYTISSAKISDQHRIWDFRGLLLSSSNHRLKDGAWSGGGPFYQYSDTWSLNTSSVPWKQKTGGIGIPARECIYATPPFSSTNPTTPSWSSLYSLMAGYEATGFRRTRPGNAVAGLGQFIVELRDLPQIPLRHFNKLLWFRSLGSEYLNAVFGWKPFVNDLIKMYNLWHTIDDRMNKLIRQNGHGIHRKATLDDSSSQSVSLVTHYTSPLAGISGIPPSVFGAGSGVTDTKLTTITSQKIWYVASYKYWIPDIGSSQWDKRARLALFGALPSPELLWEVLPWSWLIDWFSNVGDVISNLSPNAVDNLVRNYSYVMCTQTTEDIYSCTTSWSAKETSAFSVPAGSGTWHSTRKRVVKARIGGLNPYGFGIQLGNLSNYQLAILAALGISRQKLL